MSHVSVLLDEAIAALNLARGSSVLDATINGGGHSVEICRRLDGSGVLLGIDLDRDALEKASVRLQDCGVTVHLKEGNYAQMEHLAHAVGVTSFDAILFDLGLSSNQLEEAGRGFSFMRNEPLVMTFSASASEDAITAREIVNEWEETTIADVLYGYGEERFARRIAKAIVEARRQNPIETTNDLVAIIERATPRPYHRLRAHPATKSFQALRIAVNDELESIRKGIEASLRLLAPKGRLAIITFHSIEDRIVKVAFVAAEKERIATVLTKKPIVPTKAEIENNPRARSAKLRILERLT